jgi:hypothetical protein
LDGSHAYPRPFFFSGCTHSILRKYGDANPNLLTNNLAQQKTHNISVPIQPNIKEMINNKEQGRELA